MLGFTGLTHVCRCRIMVLAVLCLLALAAADSRAQSSGGGRGGGWKITYTMVGTYTVTGTPPGGTAVTSTLLWSDTGVGSVYNQGNVLQYYDNKVVLDGTMTINVKWTGSQATLPPTVTLLMFPSASWSASAQNPFSMEDHSANDAYGDPEVVNNTATSHTGSSSYPHGHIATYDTTTGSATATLPVHAMMQFTAPQGGAGGAIGCGVNAVVDDRLDNITASIDPTYYRSVINGVPTRVVNINKMTGFAVGDTVSPPPTAAGPGTSSVVYSGTYSGRWGQYSSFAWQSNLDGLGGYGEFNPTSIGAQREDYTSTIAPPNTHDVVYLTLTDSVDAAVAHAAYLLIFHNEYEDWVRTSLVQHPGPWSVTNTEWHYLFSIDNHTSQVITQTAGQTYTYQFTETGEIGGKQGLDIPGLSAFEVNEKISVGKQITTTISATQTYPCAPYCETAFYAAQSWEARTGTCSDWGQNGYNSDEGWTGTYSSGMLSLYPYVVMTYPGYKP